MFVYEHVCVCVHACVSRPHHTQPSQTDVYVYVHVYIHYAHMHIYNACIHSRITISHVTNKRTRYIYCSLFDMCFCFGVVGSI